MSLTSGAGAGAPLAASYDAAAIISALEGLPTAAYRIITKIALERLIFSVRDLIPGKPSYKPEALKIESIRSQLGEFPSPLQEIINEIVKPILLAAPPAVSVAVGGYLLGSPDPIIAELAAEIARLGGGVSDLFRYHRGYPTLSPENYIEELTEVIRRKTLFLGVGASKDPTQRVQFVLTLAPPSSRAFTIPAIKEIITNSLLYKYRASFPGAIAESTAAGAGASAAAAGVGAESSPLEAFDETATLNRIEDLQSDPRIHDNLIRAKVFLKPEEFQAICLATLTQLTKEHAEHEREYPLESSLGDWCRPCGPQQVEGYCPISSAPLLEPVMRAYLKAEGKVVKEISFERGLAPSSIIATVTFSDGVFKLDLKRHMPFPTSLASIMENFIVRYMAWCKLLGK